MIENIVIGGLGILNVFTALMLVTQDRRLDRYRLASMAYVYFDALEKFCELYLEHGDNPDKMQKELSIHAKKMGDYFDEQLDNN
jgi:hypothetical protein